jgi:hypothetical protein
MKKLFILGITLIFTSLQNYAQEYATDKGALIIKGTAGFSNQSGDLYGSDDTKTFLLSPNVNYFVGRNFFIGGGLDLTSQSQGDLSMSTVAIGPQIGVAFGNPDVKSIPFLAAGIRYASMNVSYSGMGSASATGSSIYLGGGVIFAVKEHIGINLEVAANIQNLSTDGQSASGTIFSIGVGISGLLF